MQRITRTTLILCLLAWLALVTAGAEGRAGAERASARPDSSPLRVTVAELDNTARSHLERAKAYLSNGQYNEAIENVRRVMDSAGESLITLAPEGFDASYGFVRYVTARRYCHRWLASLGQSAPEVLRLYRSQVDSVAEQWFKQGMAARDPRRLERIVDELFVSSFGDDALWNLGEWALQRGEFREARACWERLSPLLRFPPSDELALAGAEGRSLGWLLRDQDLTDSWQQLGPLLTREAHGPVSWIAYPDTEFGLDDVRARLVLVSILEGDTERARRELEMLRRLAPLAAGRIGGRKGTYLDLLQELLTESLHWPAVSASSDWTSFAGDARRSSTAVADVDVCGEPVWQVALPRWRAADSLAGSQRLRVAESSDGLLSHHPLVVGELVLICTGLGQEDFEGLRLHTGEVVFPRGAAAPRNVASDEIFFQAAGVPRFTMTAQGNWLYARVGSPVTGVSTEEARRVEPPGRIVALDLGAERRLEFEIRLDGPEWGEGWAFEGTPVSDGTRLYVALRRRDLVRAEAQVACFDAQQGRLLWRQPIGAAESTSETRALELTHNLLALDQGTLYYNTNLGLVAALRACDGNIRWLTTYPRTSPNRSDPDLDDRYALRDLNPCVVHRDRVFAAPADCDRIFALDAITGHVMWMTAPDLAVDVVHLLGVGSDRLLASGDCLYWLDVDTGKCVGVFPRPVRALPGHGRPSPRGFGRGLLAASHVYWPTREAIFVFEQRTVRSPRGWEGVLVREMPLRPCGATGGNLVIAEDTLLVATADHLYAFHDTGKPEHVAGR